MVELIGLKQLPGQDESQVHTVTSSSVRSMPLCLFFFMSACFSQRARFFNARHTPMFLPRQGLINALRHHYVTYYICGFVVFFFLVGFFGMFELCRQKNCAEDSYVSKLRSLLGLMSAQALCSRRPSLPLYN